MTYRETLKAYNLPENVAIVLATELEYKDALRKDAYNHDAHGEHEEASKLHKCANNRTIFLLGMIASLRAMSLVDEKTDAALVDLAYEQSKQP